MYRGDLVSRLMDSAEQAAVTIRPAGELRRVWTAVVHHYGYGWNKDSRCLARIYSDGVRAVVVLTELADNPGTSVTNCYERIAILLRTAVTQFIPSANFPSKVVWLEQYEVRPREIDLVTMVWDVANQGREAFFHPSWHRLTESTSHMYGVSWEELCQIQ
jgi:hypothetical protein